MELTKQPSPKKHGVRYQIVNVLSQDGLVTMSRYDWVNKIYEDIVFTKEAYKEAMGISEEIRETPIEIDANIVTHLSKMKEEAMSASFGTKQYGNLWIFEVNLKTKGDNKFKHAHEFDHLHLIAQGKAKVVVYDNEDNVLREEVFIAPAWIKLPKDIQHEIIALEDNTIGYCIHPVRNEDGLVIDSNYIESYAHEPDKCDRIKETKCH